MKDLLRKQTIQGVQQKVNVHLSFCHGVEGYDDCYHVTCFIMKPKHALQIKDYAFGISRDEAEACYDKKVNSYTKQLN